MRQLIILFIEAGLSGDGAQFVCELLHCREPLLWSFSQCCVEHLVNLGRYTGDGFRSRRYWTAGVLHHDGEGGMAPEELLAGDHFIVDHSQGIFIGTSIDRAAEGEFGSRIFRVC